MADFVIFFRQIEVKIITGKKTLEPLLKCTFSKNELKLSFKNGWIELRVPAHSYIQNAHFSCEIHVSKGQTKSK
jgi:hypothetical protein